MTSHIRIFVLLFTLTFSVNSQNVSITGTITDSKENTLEYANILAVPIQKNQEVKFAITNKNGNYKLNLTKNQTYNITVSYLGYKSQVISLTVKEEDLKKDFILKENPNQLDEITLKYTSPVSVKKDTITYKVDAFTTGQERKLREVLKKLPGVEVDREGNVTVQGKKITKVLVENKIFFSGNSKMAVNNIPADAVDKVEVLDNYTDVAMLKGLEDSDDIALNIKLKEDKKNFAFGDIEVGGGIEERYVIHPNLFYYSPKTNINFIGDLNNQGVKSFSFRDYLEFEGGFGKLMSDAGSYFSLFKSDFAQYLNNQDFIDNINQFGAINIRQAINSSADISGYVISSNSKTQTESNALNSYQNTANPFIENRTVTNSLDNFFTIGKITIDYEPSYEEDFAYNLFLKATNSTSNGLISTVNPNQNNLINTLTDTKAFNLKQNISYSRKLSKTHTATLEATYNFESDKPITEWLTNQRILQGLIPLESADLFNIIQTKRSKSHNFNTIIKDYWVLNNFNHLYTSFGFNTSFNGFLNQDGQLLANGSLNNFNTSNFGNDFNYTFFNTFIGLEYKFQIGIATFKPALFHHNYLWRTQQFEVSENFSKNLLLPQFTTKVEFNNSEKLNLKYSLKARFPGINQLANNFILSSFNSVFRGNNKLENQLYHSASLSYYKFSLFKNLNFNLNTNFSKRIKTIKTVTELNGIESFNSTIMFDQPEHNWSFNGSISKKINKIRYNLSTSFDYNDFFQLLNNGVDLNISKSVSSTIGIETFFKNHPNLEINYTKDFNTYTARGLNNDFENDSFEVILEYDFLKDFILKADYRFDIYQNKSQQIENTFDIANTSLFYQKEDRPWGFEITATNLFDLKFKQQNSFNSFIISDRKTFILPRIIMFKLSYKL